MSLNLLVLFKQNSERKKLIILFNGIFSGGHQFCLWPQKVLLSLLSSSSSKRCKLYPNENGSRSFLFSHRYRFIYQIINNDPYWKYILMQLNVLKKPVDSLGNLYAHAYAMGDTHMPWVLHWSRKNFAMGWTTFCCCFC